jgi:hypothetical protein
MISDLAVVGVGVAVGGPGLHPVAAQLLLEDRIVIKLLLMLTQLVM